MMHPPDRRLDEVLHCVHVIDLCLHVDRGEVLGGHHKVGSDMGPMLGVMDWVTELHRLLQGGATAMSEFGVRNPNLRQVGGDHYGGSQYQHWDLMVDLVGPGYLVGCATKYLARTKEPRKDLEKAVHYIEKLISLYTPGGLLDGHLPGPRSRHGWTQYCKENHPTQAVQDVTLLLLGYTTLEELYTAKRLTEKMIGEL